MEEAAEFASSTRRRRPFPRTEGFVTPAPTLGMVRPAAHRGSESWPLGSPVHDLLGVLLDLDADVLALASDTEVEPEMFDDPTEQASSVVLGRLLARAAARTGCGYIGMLAGQRTTLTSLGALGDLMRSAGTLRSAIGDLTDHFHLQHRGAVVHLSVAEDLATLTYGIYDCIEEGAGLLCERAVAGLVALFRELLGPEWAPAEVMLPRQAPARLAPYWHYFRAPVRFNEERGAIQFPSHLLGQPLPGADPVSRRIAEDRIAAQEAHAPRTFSETLRGTLHTDFLDLRYSAKLTSDRLSVHRRTLHRWLRTEGLTFKVLANEVRMAIAIQLLADTKIDITVIGAALDFSEPAAFTRAFRRWTGCTPSAWRSSRAVDKPRRRLM